MKIPKDKLINYAMIAAGVLILFILVWRNVIKPMRDRRAAQEETGTPGTTGTTTKPGGSSAPVYTNATVFSYKSPMMKSDRVKWMQAAYNKYAKDRKKYGKTPDWPTISEDSVFGKNTQSAINRILGKNTASWDEVKARIDYYNSQLAVAGLNIPTNDPYSDPYGYNGYFSPKTCARCEGKGYVTNADIIRLGKVGQWLPGTCSACNGTGKI